MDYEKIAKKYRKKKLTDHSISDTSVKVNYKRDDIKKLIEHREPFLYLDEIESLDYKDYSAIGKSLIRKDEPFFNGHFPNNPILPGVIGMEMIGQLSICSFSLFRQGHTHIDKNKDYKMNIRILKLHHALFQYEMLPDEHVTLMTKALEYDDYTIKGIGQAIKNDGKIATVVIGEFYVIE